MGEALSQRDIDKLLTDLASGELDADRMRESEEKQVKGYDFNHPTKFSKEQDRKSVV